MLLTRRLGDGRHESRAATLRDVCKLVCEQPQCLRRIGCVASAKRNRAAIGERVGVLVGRDPLRYRPAIHAHARRIDTCQPM